MPHTALFGLSIFMALLFTALSALFALIETGASEPLSRNYLSLSSAPPPLLQWLQMPAGSPSHQLLILPCLACPPPPKHASADGSHFFIRRLIKFALPLMPVALKTVPKWEVRGGAAASLLLLLSAGRGALSAARSPPPCPPQGWALFLLASYFLYITIRRVPFHRAYLNIGEAFLYSWCWLAAGLAVLGTYYPQVETSAAGSLLRRHRWLRHHRCIHLPASLTPLPACSTGPS